MHRPALRALATLLFATLAVGCGDDADPTGPDRTDAGDAAMTDTSAADTGATDAGATDTADPLDVDAGTTDAAPDDTGATDTGAMDAAPMDAANDADDASPDVTEDATPDATEDAAPDVGPPTTATLVGAISRSTDPSRGADAVGDVYIALFDNEPILDRDQMPVAFLIVEAVDLSDPITTVPYRLEGIAPRAEAYWISAFLDDNGNASTDDAGPDRGDLVMLERFVPPESRRVTIAEPGEQTQVIDLNNVLPF